MVDWLVPERRLFVSDAAGPGGQNKKPNRLPRLLRLPHLFQDGQGDPRRSAPPHMRRLAVAQEPKREAAAWITTLGTHRV
jgi:hypothetical protein